MYYPGNWQYDAHVKKYGNPKDFGFKDVINEWKAEEWEPDSLIRFYKSVGARFFMTLANHHDNMDLWDSKYQSWNSVNMGPKRNVLGEWEKAARKNKLPFGVSIHSSHAWTWYETAQGADKKGPYAGISYDARVVTKEDGKGKWWEGYDPQELYVQNHALSRTCLGCMGLARRNLCPPTELLRQLLRPHSGHDKQVSSRPGLFRRQRTPLLAHQRYGAESRVALL